MTSEWQVKCITFSIIRFLIIGCFFSVFTNVFAERLYYFLTDDYFHYLRRINRSFFGRSFYVFKCKKQRLYIKITRSLCLERLYTTLSFETRVSLIPLLLVSLVLPLTRFVWVCLYYRCFFADFSLLLLMWRWHFWNDVDNYFFSKFFSFFSELQKLLWPRKKYL